MSNPIDLSQTHEFRDVTGSVVGYYLPAREFEARFGNSPHAEDGTPARQSLEQRHKELTEERDRLRAEVAQLRAERDLYLKSVYVLTREEIPFTRDEVFNRAPNRPTLDQIIAELE